MQFLAVDTYNDIWVGPVSQVDLSWRLLYARINHLKCQTKRKSELMKFWHFVQILVIFLFICQTCYITLPCGDLIARAVRLYNRANGALGWILQCFVNIQPFNSIRRWAFLILEPGCVTQEYECCWFCGRFCSKNQWNYSAIVSQEQGVR